ncbi:tubulin gamma chain [Curvularia clavata]|uniref:Tubulin gamma chain n=1 Tax=Curvularia clavata TaxID=95742 RepID=A0A9Q8ZBG0_CURCL|nr:tubulin gamma chain [Curvularia clavata]
MVSSQQGYAETTVDMKGNTQAVNEAQSNLPLPDQPPVASDFNSSDARTVNVGSGSQEDKFASGGGALREPAVGAGGAAGREAKDGLSGIPNDAVSREAKDHSGLADTTGKDYGYPSKNDPSSGIKQ